MEAWFEFGSALWVDRELCIWCQDIMIGEFITYIHKERKIIARLNEKAQERKVYIDDLCRRYGVKLEEESP